MERFCWSQLESADYPTYVANLRSVGCPEQTIREILTADVASLYDSRRHSLEEWLARAGLAERSVVERELAVLHTEQMAFLSRLLEPGYPSTLNLSDRSPHFFPSRAGRQELPATITVPLAFREVDYSALKFSPGQVHALSELRERFAAQMGSVPQDPSDPAYTKCWLEAQPQSDKELRGIIGLRAYQNLELLARAMAGAERRTGPD
jgi:hypothetical protein